MSSIWPTPASKTEGRWRKAEGGRIRLLVLGLLLAACVPVTRPVVKIALAAPFEGRYREVGYEVIYAVRLAVREANAAGGIAGHSIELLALDDAGDVDLARAQARKASADPQVVAAVGHWLEATTLAAAEQYARDGLPLLATAAAPGLPASAFRLWPAEADLASALPGARLCPLPCGAIEDLSWLEAQEGSAPPVAGPPLWGLAQFAALAGGSAEGVYVIAPAPLPADSADPGFAESYRAISSGVEPRSFAVLAYDAAQFVFSAIELDIEQNGEPTRGGVAGALGRAEIDGLSGPIRFDAGRDWAGRQGWVYRWKAGQLGPP